MTKKDAITEIPQALKVETDFHDLGMYGEYYGLIISFSNGRRFSIRIQEHEFNNFYSQANAQPKEISDQQHEYDSTKEDEVNTR